MDEAVRAVAVKVVSGRVGEVEAVAINPDPVRQGTVFARVAVIKNPMWLVSAASTVPVQNAVQE